MRNLCSFLILSLVTPLALSAPSIFTPEHRLPDLNQMHPEFLPILGEGWPLCAPVIGGNLVAWLQDQKILSEKIIEKNALKVVDEKSLQSWVRKFASAAYMNTRDGHGTDGVDFLRGLDKGLQDLNVKPSQIRSAGPAFGKEQKINLSFFEARSPRTVYFLFLGFYLPSTSAPGWRRQKGHALMVFPHPNHKQEWLAVDTSAASAGPPTEQAVSWTENKGLQFRKENRFYKGASVDVLELRGIKPPPPQKADKIVIEGAAAYTF